MESGVYSLTAGRLSGDRSTVSPRTAFSEARASASDREIAAMVLKGFGLDVQILMRERQVSWLRDVLDSAAADNLCVSLNCTTCGSDAFELLLTCAGEQAGLRRNASFGGMPDFVGIATALADLPYVDPRDEPAIRLIIWRMYRSLGEQAFARDVAPILYSSEAGRVLRSMEHHHEAAQKRRGLHQSPSDSAAVTRRRAGTFLTTENREQGTKGKP
jgi:hypothetical protein